MTTSAAFTPRRNEKKMSADDYPTHPQTTRDFLNKLVLDGIPMVGTTWEPAANRGYMAEVLKEFGMDVIATDLYDYGYCESGVDFVASLNAKKREIMESRVVYNVITNPPFNQLSEFIDVALEIAWKRVAVLCQLTKLEGKKRFDNIYKPHPPTWVYQYVRRQPFLKGTIETDNDDEQKSSKQVAFMWMVWDKSSMIQYPKVEPTLRWIE